MTNTEFRFDHSIIWNSDLFVIWCL
jgi:hypothetical protein